MSYKFHKEGMCDRCGDLIYLKYYMLWDKIQDARKRGVRGEAEDAKGELERYMLHRKETREPLSEKTGVVGLK